MAGRGTYLAITDEQRAAIEDRASDVDRIYFILDELYEQCYPDFELDCDKAWDALHRALSDFPPDTPWFYPVDPDSPYTGNGKHALPEDHGTLPLKLCVLGGIRLIEDESVGFARLIERDQIPALADALSVITEDGLRDKYFTHCRGAWPEYGEEDFVYTWEYFAYIRDFMNKMNGNGRHILFAADQ